MNNGRINRMHQCVVDVVRRGPRMRSKFQTVVPLALVFVLALLPFQFVDGTLAFGLDGGGLRIAAGTSEEGGGPTPEGISYVERSWDDANNKMVEKAAVSTEAIPVPADGNMTSGWYYLGSNVTKNGRIESITGDVNLILCDGFTLDVGGLYVPEGKTLTIYGQSKDTGKIHSHPSDGAAIGGYSGHDNGNIAISGGTIVANGYNNCAGIGANDGRVGGDIAIYGGTVTAEGGKNGAGIGGGTGNKAGGSVAINGGIINASGGYGIGSGEKGADVSIDLNYTNATQSSVSITASSFNGSVTMKRPFRNDKGNYGAYKSYNYNCLAGSALVAWNGKGSGVDYFDPSKGPVTHTGEYSTLDSSVTTWGSGWYVLGSNMTLKHEIAVMGDVNLILKDGNTLRVPNIKVPVSSKLTICGQSGGSGTIVATADHEAKAGIGGAGCDCGTITINGGTIEATGGKAKKGYGSAGIGGAKDYNPGPVIINGGTVTANGGTMAAGIGGGGYDDGANVTITGGTVKATGGDEAAGIGGGCWAEGRTCAITGGHVTAIGGEGAAGIGNSNIGGGSGKAEVVLSYTDADMSVYASSYSARIYGGTITLRKPFKNADDESQTFAAAEGLGGDYFDFINSMSGITLVPAPDLHSVTFDVDGADKVAPQAVEDGACAQEPAKPSKKGFRFIGWRLVGNGKMSPTDFDFSTPITGDVLLKAFFTSENEHNADRFEIKTLDNAPAIDSPNMAEVVGATLTQAELDAGHSLHLVSSPLSEAEVPSGDKAALEGKAKDLGATPGTWFDLSLYKVLGEEQTQISEAGCPVQITMKVPVALQKDGRAFYVLRSHDGKATVATQGTGTTLAWETDEFSSYAIAYKDSGASENKTPTDNSSSSRAVSPKTGDHALAGAIGVVLACAAVALAAGGVALRRKGE